MAHDERYRSRWNDPAFIALYRAFKGYILLSDVTDARTCAAKIAKMVSADPATILELGVGDGRVSFAFLEGFRQHRRIQRYTGIDISPQLVQLVECQRELFSPYVGEMTVTCADATTYEPPAPADVILALNSWYGMPFSGIPRYLHHLKPRGCLAILTDTKANMISDLSRFADEPTCTGEELTDYLSPRTFPMLPFLFTVSVQEVYDNGLFRKNDFLDKGRIRPEAEFFFRYAARRPQGRLDDIERYLREKPEGYFSLPHQLAIIRRGEDKR